MKIISYIRLVLIFSATFLTTFAFGQELVTAKPEPETYFALYFFSFAIFVILVPFLIEFIKRKINSDKSSINLTISWITGVIVSLLCHFLGLGIFGDLTTLQVLATGFGASLAANGVFDSGVVTKLYNSLQTKLNK